MKILVTAFTPFGLDPTNPTMEILGALPDQLSGARIIKQILPTKFRDSTKLVAEVIAHQRPDVVVNLGQAAGRNAITPETTAVNEDDAGIMDNAGYQPHHQIIHPDGAPHYGSSLPVKDIVSTLQKHHIPSQLSNNAGRYVCNHVMYEVQYLAHTRYPQMKAGFIHVPSHTASQPDTPTMPLDTEIQGIKLALTTIINNS